MTTPFSTYPYPLGGSPNGRYRSAITTTPCSTAGTSYTIASVGTGTSTTSSTWVTVTILTDSTGVTTGRTYAYDPSTGALTPAVCTPVPVTLGNCEVKPPRFEDAGVKAGEIIGIRAWYLKNDTLYSMYMQDYAWTPGGVEHAFGLGDRYTNVGLHAFKHAGPAIANYAPLAHRCRPVVFGEIAMWGEVYEHERGYRAEFAAIRKIYGMVRTAHYCGELGVGRRRGLWPRTTELEILRKRYGVVE